MSATMRLLAERTHVVAEGVGKVVCVVSGGTLDSAKLAKILTSQIP